MRAPTSGIGQDVAEPSEPFKANRRLTALACALATAARPLLSPTRSVLLGVSRQQECVRLFWWDAAFQISAGIDAEPEQFCPAQSPEGDLQRAGEALIAYLSGRWPAHAAPAELGVITDGTGVAFAPERPSPAAPGWLLQHAADASPLHMIVPLDPVGPAALLFARPGPALLH